MKNKSFLSVEKILQNEKRCLITILIFILKNNYLESSSGNKCIKAKYQDVFQESNFGAINLLEKVDLK